MQYVKVNPLGRIVERLTASPLDALLSTPIGQDGWFIAEGDIDPEVYWFNEGQQAKRPALTRKQPKVKADGKDTFSINVPADGEAVFIRDGRRLPVDISDGRFEFQTTVPGEYTFEFDCFPYRKTVLTVIAHAV